MRASELKANRLILNRMNEFVFDGNNVWCPIFCAKSNQLADAFDAVADSTVRVTFTTHGDHADDDKKTYSRRLAKLPPYYVRSPWSPVVVRGVELQSSFCCTVTRVIR